MVGQSNIKPIRTLDLTPTWEAMVPIFCAVLQEGSAESRTIIREELLRMARIADLYVAQCAPKEPDEE